VRARLSQLAGRGREDRGGPIWRQMAQLGFYSFSFLFFCFLFFPKFMFFKF
jgi:hypothetical protein